jgi:hypothetical protein
LTPALLLVAVLTLAVEPFLVAQLTTLEGVDFTETLLSHRYPGYTRREFRQRAGNRPPHRGGSRPAASTHGLKQEQTGMGRASFGARITGITVPP